MLLRIFAAFCIFCVLAPFASPIIAAVAATISFFMLG